MKSSPFKPNVKPLRKVLSSVWTDRCIDWLFVLKKKEKGTLLERYSTLRKNFPWGSVSKYWVYSLDDECNYKRQHR